MVRGFRGDTSSPMGGDYSIASVDTRGKGWSPEADLAVCRYARETAQQHFERNGEPEKLREEDEARSETIAKLVGTIRRLRARTANLKRHNLKRARNGESRPLAVSR